MANTGEFVALIATSQTSIVTDKCSLEKLAQKLVKEGPHKVEQTPRRVRGLFNGKFAFDTTSAYFVWEHPYYPQ